MTGIDRLCAEWDAAMGNLRAAIAELPKAARWIIYLFWPLLRWQGQGEREMTVDASEELDKCKTLLKEIQEAKTETNDRYARLEALAENIVNLVAHWERLLEK